MTNREQTKRDIVVALDFAGQILENPDLLEDIPKGASITFLDDENVKAENIRNNIAERKYVKVKRHFEVL